MNHLTIGFGPYSIHLTRIYCECNIPHYLITDEARSLSSYALERLCYFADLGNFKLSIESYEPLRDEFSFTELSNETFSQNPLKILYSRSPGPKIFQGKEPIKAEIFNLKLHPSQDRDPCERYA